MPKPNLKQILPKVVSKGKAMVRKLALDAAFGKTKKGAKNG